MVQVKINGDQGDDNYDAMSHLHGYGWHIYVFISYLVWLHVVWMTAETDLKNVCSFTWLVNFNARLLLFYVTFRHMWFSVLELYGHTCMTANWDASLSTGKLSLLQVKVCLLLALISFSLILKRNLLRKGLTVNVLLHWEENWH